MRRLGGNQFPGYRFFYFMVKIKTILIIEKIDEGFTFLLLNRQKGISQIKFQPQCVRVRYHLDQHLTRIKALISHFHLVTC